MTALRSDFLATVTARGFVHQCTDTEGLDAALSAGRPRLAYIGFDCTADSLHVGSLVPIMLLRWLQKTGHKPIVLMGGGTTKVGDPSGKDEARKLLSDADIARNMAGIKTVFAKYLSFGDGPTDAVMVNNDDWLSGLQYIPFLREYGTHFSVNRMLSFESVKLRLEREQPLSFLEFNYMILQAYDFVELARRMDCILQMGGSDQWGNIVNGVELGRRVDGRELYGLTSPLITTASGAKMGKTAQGAIWLNEDRLSPTTTGSSGATPRTPTSAASCACSPNCRSPRSSAWKPCRAPRSTTPRRCWPSRRRGCATAPRRPRPPPRRRAAPSRKARWAMPCPVSPFRWPNCRPACPPSRPSAAPASPPATATPSA